MKKYTHPKKITSLIISKNGSSNYSNIFTNNIFVYTSFDIRQELLINIESDDSINNDSKLSIFINEYQYTKDLLWSNFIKK